MNRRVAGGKHAASMELAGTLAGVRFM